MKRFECDGEMDTCLSCPLARCIRDFCTVDGEFIRTVIKRSREERRAYEREYYAAHRERRIAQIRASQKRRSKV